MSTKIKNNSKKIVKNFFSIKRIDSTVQTTKEKSTIPKEIPHKKILEQKIAPETKANPPKTTKNTFKDLNLTIDQLHAFVDLIFEKQESIAPYNPYNKILKLLMTKFDLNQSLVLALLDEMVSFRLLTKRLDIKGAQCPTDHGNDLNPIFSCPFCNSNFFENGETIEHLTCGHVDFSSHFYNNTCPKCQKKLSQLGVDYRKTDAHFKCLRCGEFFGNPNLLMECQDCKRKYEIEKVEWLDTFFYTPTSFSKKSDFEQQKVAFFNSLQTQVKLSLPNFPIQSNDLIIISKNAYPEIINEYFKYFDLNPTKKCIYLSFNKSAEEINHIMEGKNKYNLKSIHLVDLVSTQLGIKQNKNYNFGKCSYLDTSNAIKKLEKKIISITKEKAWKDSYIFIDSGSTINTDYPTKAEEFLHSLLIKMSTYKKNTILLILRDVSSEKFLGQMIQYCDQFYEL